MKCLLSLAMLATVVAADIDWSRVRPIEEFDHYWARLPPKLQALRQAMPNQRVINGQEAYPGQFPYQVVLISDYGSISALCGASVLSNNFILTAAHCVVDATGGIALMGAHNRQNNEPTQQSCSFSSDGINIHPQYNPTTFRNDVATVRLNIPVVFNDRVQPVKLPAHSDTRTFSGWFGTVSGFGRTSDDSLATSDVLRYTYNAIITNANCLERWDNNVDLIGPQNICLSGEYGRASCGGDSGGPLTIPETEFSLQVGLVSFGSAAGCAIGIPSVFARTSFFLEWIEENSDVVVEP
ncbi:brachyurin-like [Topomyia yanbarensis]|uniref:brachyurin-like n=1 Tax=Topomyia yanbarensis TaxID=2498891 RepID=UPI00273BE316|nr:brachyurin-like [Topomyia yanbarensis]